MKTTLEIPDAIFRRAKAKASERGVPLRQFVSEAVAEKLGAKSPAQHKARTRLAGRLQHLRNETARIKKVIEQEFARSPDEYIAKIRRRGLSDLVALGEAEFQKGVRSMKEAAANESGPVIEPVDLFVFRKVA